MSNLTRSAKCPECGNDTWEICGDKAECMNCLYRRPYHRRKPSNEISTSQKRAIKRIRDFFSDWGRYNYLDRPEPKPLKVFDVRPTDYGGVWVKVKEGPDNPYVEVSAHIYVGPRGKIEVSRANDGLSNTTEHVARMLHGHAWKR